MKPVCQRNRAARHFLAGPAHFCKPAHTGYPDIEPFRAEQIAFYVQKCAISAEPAAGGNVPVTGHPRVAAPAHHGADRAGGSGSAGQEGDIAVGRHSPDRNPSDHSEDTRAEI